MNEPLRLDYVSPLPPVRSGISDYSSDLLPHLEPLCDLRVLRLDDQPVADEIVERWSPQPAHTVGVGERLPLYQMGNNRYHSHVRRLALGTPGVLTLHDLVLHHLLLEETLAEQDFEGYEAALAEEYDWLGERVAAPRRRGGFGNAAHFALPMHCGLLRRQRGVLVHSEWAAAEVRAAYPELRVRSIAMGIPLPAAASPREGRRFRQRHALPLDAPLLGSFGFQTPIKRTDVAIAALAQPQLSDVHLLVVGEGTPIYDLDKIAHEAGVADRVHVLGFLDYDEFEAAISACDLCLNLRYPTAGETSASLLRVLAVGCPAVVSDYAQFAELPDEVAVRVPLGDGEIEVLAGSLAELLAAPDRLAAMGPAARRYVGRRHDPGAAARQVVDACLELEGLDPPAGPRRAISPPTTLLHTRPRGTIEVAGGERPWKLGEARRLDVEVVNTGDCSWLPTIAGTGGLFLKVQWHGIEDEAAGRWDERKSETPVELSWFKVQREVRPGQRLEVSVDVRRPLGGEILIVEPYLKSVAGFYDLGGPIWVREL